MNVGDLLQFYSGGRYPATLHRVVVPKEEAERAQPRQSVVFFLHPDGETDVENVTGEGIDYPKTTAKEHVLKRFAETYQY